MKFFTEIQSTVLDSLLSTRNHPTISDMYHEQEQQSHQLLEQNQQMMHEQRLDQYQQQVQQNQHTQSLQLPPQQQQQQSHCFQKTQHQKVQQQ